MNIKEALEYIHSVSWKGSIPGLERTRELLHLMGNPEKKLKFIHIVGTNGKGSTASMSAKILEMAGLTVGLYTSPYIFEFNERMRVNGDNISDGELAEITEFIKPLADSMEDTPTEFELVTCIAFEYFARRKCDIVCLEAGMGGELDSTNVIDSPEACVITNIGLDHTEFLGGTIEKIAETKSKVIKEGTSVVLYRSAPSVEAVIESRCREVGAALYKSDFDAVELVCADLEAQTVNWKNIRNIRLPLLGEHQIKNAATVLTLIQVLRSKGWHITDDAVKSGLEHTVWQGRFEVIARQPTFIVDGGHNPQCIESLVKNVKDYIKSRPLVILTGVLADKDYDSMYRDMTELADVFYTVTPPNPRALTADRLAEYLKSIGARAIACTSIDEGVKLAKNAAGQDGTVLAYGSLYMVGDITRAVK